MASEKRRWPSRQQQAFVDMARCAALKSVMTHRHGSVVVDARNHVVSVGVNHVKRFMSHTFSVHAECDALFKARRRRGTLRDCVMFVVRVGKDGTLRDSKPCAACQCEIEHHGLRRVLYSKS